VGTGPLPVTEQGLFPAEHRALRELYAMAGQLASHWGALAPRIGGTTGDVLERGAAAGRELLRELADRTAAHGLHGVPAAEGLGTGGAWLKNAGDLMLERNQALRRALVDVQQVTTLLAYLAELADRRDGAALAAWERAWQARMADLEDAARRAAVAEGEHAERAIAPADPGSWGRAGHTVASGLGTLGEAIDGSPIGRAARRARGKRATRFGRAGGAPPRGPAARS
jgi:hypothetical protein